QTKPFERRGPEQWIVAGFSYDHHGIAAPTFVLECRGGEPATNDLPVREDKVASRVRFDVERAKNSARNQRVAGTRIDKTTDFFSAAAVRRVADPDADECQAHLDTLSPARNCPHRPRCPFRAICGQRLLIVLPIFFALAPGPHRLRPNAAAALGTPPRRELTLMRRRRLCLAAARTPTRCRVGDPARRMAAGAPP